MNKSKAFVGIDQERREDQVMLYHAVTDPDDDRIWNAILEHEGQTFRTARGLEYEIRL